MSFPSSSPHGLRPNAPGKRTYEAAMGNSEVSYEWIVQSFSMELGENRRYIDSPNFPAEDNNKSLKWFLRLYPKGDKEENSEYLSLFLCLDSHRKVRATSTFAILNEKREKRNLRIVSPGLEHNQNSGNGWGITQFIKRDILFNETSGLLVNGNLILYCKVNVFANFLTVPRLNASLMNIPRLMNANFLNMPSLMNSSNFLNRTGLLIPGLNMPGPMNVNLHNITDQSSDNFQNISSQNNADSINISSQKNDDITNISGQKIVIQVPDSHLSEDLGKLFEDKNTTDVILSVNGHEFGAHKIILCVRSPVFAAMFEHDMAELKQNKVEITDVDPETFKEILRFIYTGKAPNIEEMAYSLLVAANYYGLDRLKAMCEEALSSNLSVNNVSHILTFADMHDAKQLRSFALDFVARNVDDVMASVGWKTVETHHPELVSEVCRTLSKLSKPDAHV